LSLVLYSAVVIVKLCYYTYLYRENMSQDVKD